MTDRIEPGCLCVVVATTGEPLHNPARVVRAVHPLSTDEAVIALAPAALAGVSAALECIADVVTGRVGVVWSCEQEDPVAEQIWPEQLLRRLPPPPTEFLTREKDLEVTE